MLPVLYETSDLERERDELQQEAQVGDGHKGEDQGDVYVKMLPPDQQVAPGERNGEKENDEVIDLHSGTSLPAALYHCGRRQGNCFGHFSPGRRRRGGKTLPAVDFFRGST